MPRRPPRDDQTGYELAARDVVASFDPPPLKPAPNPDHRIWVLEGEAARLLGLTKRALERRRSRGTSPAHHQRMGLTAYYIDDLDTWVASKPKAYRPPAD